MKIKLKSWDEVVELAKQHDNYDFDGNMEYVWGMRKSTLPWGDKIESLLVDEFGNYFVDGDWWVHDWMVEDADPDDILRYGEIITDDAYGSVVTEFGKRQAVRIRLIFCDGFVWYHKMVDGDLVECSKVGKRLDA